MRNTWSKRGRDRGWAFFVDLLQRFPGFRLHPFCGVDDLRRLRRSEHHDFRDFPWWNDAYGSQAVLVSVQYRLVVVDRFLPSDQLCVPLNELGCDGLYGLNLDSNHVLLQRLCEDPNGVLIDSRPVWSVEEPCDVRERCVLAFVAHDHVFPELSSDGLNRPGTRCTRQSSRRSGDASKNGQVTEFLEDPRFVDFWEFHFYGAQASFSGCATYYRFWR